jgi:hypothetical protein
VATNFPGSTDSFPRPTSTTNTDDGGYELDVVIDHLSDALELVERYLGGTPAAQWASRLGQPAVGNYVPIMADGGHATMTLSTTTLNSSTKVQITPIMVAGAYTFDKVGLYLSTPATDSGSVFAFAVYDPRTGDLLQDCGTFDATAAAGLKEPSVSFSLPAGLYYMATRFKTSTTAGTNPVVYATDNALGHHSHTILDSNNHYSTVAWTVATSTASWPSNLSGMNAFSYLTGTGAPTVPRVSLRRSA